MSTVNLYDVLQIKQEATRKEVKNAYRTLVKEFHPDKQTGDAEMFELITHAYNVLYNESTRKEYDQVYALSQQSGMSHNTLKSQATNYYEAQKNDITKKGDTQRKKDFKDAFSEMDQKHKYKRGDNDDKINKKDAIRRVRDLETVREQENIELTQDNLFEGGSFNLAKFNAAFIAMNGGPSELIPHSGNPSAWAMPSGVGGLDTNYSSLDNHGDLYVEDDNHIGLDGQNFSSVHFSGSTGTKKRLTKEDIKNLSEDINTSGHNTVDQAEFDRVLAERLAERDAFNTKLDNREMGEDDFDTDPSCGGYGIFNHLGMDKISTITWDNDLDLDSKYKRLLEMRKDLDSKN